jgi:ABC-type amino acid transport substrate-binding protein
MPPLNNRKLPAAPPPRKTTPGQSHRIHASRALPHLAGDLQLRGVRDRRLRVAVYAHFFPVAYRDQGKLRGLDVDIIEGFCRVMGLRPTYIPVRDFFDVWRAPGDWAVGADVAIGGLGRAPWRALGGIEWSLPYFRVQRTVVYNLSNVIRSFPEDVTGPVVGTMGSTGFNNAYRLMEEAGKADLLQNRTASDKRDLADLLAGRIQGLMRGSFVGRSIVARHPKRLGMVEPWDSDPEEVGPGGGVSYLRNTTGVACSSRSRVRSMAASRTSSSESIITSQTSRSACVST